MVWPEAVWLSRVRLLCGQLLSRRAVGRPLHEVVQVSHADRTPPNEESQSELESRSLDRSLIGRSVPEPQPERPRRASGEGDQPACHDVPGNVGRLPEVPLEVILRGWLP